MNARQFHVIKRVLVIVVCAVLSAAAQAGVLPSVQVATFEPEPGSPNTPEFIWNGTEFYSGPGAFGTGFNVPGPGDGQLPTANQQAPGLLVITPYNVPGIPGGDNNPSGTSFHDVTLKIVPVSPAVLGFPAAGTALVSSGQVFQPLGPARFEIWSTDPTDIGPDVENPVLLLAGRADDAIITGLLGASSGLTLSATVTYDAGAILAVAGLPIATGEFSWNLLDAIPPLGVGLTAPYLMPFEANGTGQFSMVPEPASLSLLALTALPLLRRRGRN